MTTLEIPPDEKSSRIKPGETKREYIQRMRAVHADTDWKSRRLGNNQQVIEWRDKGARLGDCWHHWIVWPGHLS